MAENQTNTEAAQDQITDDPWAAAFAALDQAQQGDAQRDEDERDGGDTQPDAGTQTADGQGAAAQTESPDSSMASESDAGPGDAGGDTGTQDAADSESLFEDNHLSYEDYYKELSEAIVPEVLDQVFNQFKANGEHVNSNGKLRWSINDPEIRHVDQDGAVTFVNPDTGREFSGDDPRRQAQEFVDWRNDQVRQRFNQACEQAQLQKLQQFGPQLNVVKFAPTYDKMDPLRKQIFDSMIEGYEVVDANGDIVGYSCNLEKMHEMMERQITAIQSYGKQAGITSPQQPASSGPALDMHADNSASQNDKGDPKSLAEAMQRLQDKQLEDYRSKHDRRK